MAYNMPERMYGCGLLSAVFGRRVPRSSNNDGDISKTSNNQNVKRRRGASDEATVPEPTLSNASNSSSRSSTDPSYNPQRPTPVVDQPRKHHNQSAMAMHSSRTAPSKAAPTQNHVNRGRKVPKEALGISGELENMIADYQKSNGSSTLVRASSSNVMLFGNLGNLRQDKEGGAGNTNSYTEMDYHPKPREQNPVANGRHTNYAVENSANKTKEKCSQEKLGSLCRALSTRMDPEELKIMGNEDYKNGRFAEALALYDAAISVDPNKASYRSNRSAALTALGRLLEAVFECREAIRIEPHYHRAHHRLGNLYLRLGETDKALYHFKLAGPDADPDEVAKVKNVQVHLNKCTEARRLRDWYTLIKETNSAILIGANSAPQIYVLQAEAFLKLRRHQDADEAISKAPKFEVDECTQFFGPVAYANLLATWAQVDIAAGRFDAALEAAQHAARLDSHNRDANMVMRKARAVAAARSHGNDLFKASKFSEACDAYGEGLEHDPYNSVLLCNRAACRSKLGQYERAVDDCTAALNLRPSYSKARLRRAECNAKLQRWEASIQDYEILLQEIPEHEEVSRELLQAQVQLKNMKQGRVEIEQRKSRLDLQHMKKT